MTAAISEQDWDIPRNIDIIGDHFRSDVFDFSKAVSCGCRTPAGIHLPGARTNCDAHAYSDLIQMPPPPADPDGTCFSKSRNATYPCRYNKYGTCTDDSRCQGPADCPRLPGGALGRCDRTMRTCKTRCPCSDRSCPAKLDEGLPLLFEQVTNADSWRIRCTDRYTYISISIYIYILFLFFLFLFVFVCCRLY